MANVDPQAISTPSRPRYSLNSKRSGTFATTANSTNVAGFSPGGQVFEGYSYLSRSTSMSTSTRSRPKGLQSRTSSDAMNTPPAAIRNLPTSPSSPHIPRVANSPAGSIYTTSVDLPQRSNTIHRMLAPSAHPSSTLFASTHLAPNRSQSDSQKQSPISLTTPKSGFLPK